MARHDPIFVNADGRNVKCDVYETTFGIGAAFRGVHYTAASRSGLEAKLRDAAKANAHGFKPTRPGARWFS